MVPFILEVDSVEISSWVSRFLWPFFRISGFLMVMPLIGSRLVPQRIRILLAFLIAMLVTPMLPPMPHTDGLSVQTMVISAQQLLIGIAFAFMLEMLMQVMILAGQLIAMQTGLGMALMIDPSHGINVAVVAQWFLVFANLLFISLNGHLVALEIVIDSFYVIPVGFDGLSTDTLFKMVGYTQWMFASALVLSLPALTVMLVVNIAFGVMSRLAPQLNIFAVGFPVTMMLGLVVLWLCIGSFGDQFYLLLQSMLQFMRGM